MDEALDDDLSSYKSFNAFFTRQLKPEVRPLDAGANTLTSPADGVISQAGKISRNKILQAKNVDYSLTRLVGNARQAKKYENGLFSTIYLSPKDGCIFQPMDSWFLHDIFPVSYFPLINKLLRWCPIYLPAMSA